MLLTSLCVACGCAPTREGVYAVRLYKNNGWVTVFVDDNVPVVYVNNAMVTGSRGVSSLTHCTLLLHSKNLHYNVATKESGYGDPDPERGLFAVPMSVKSKDMNEYWAVLLEKAYAKYHGMLCTCCTT